MQLRIQHREKGALPASAAFINGSSVAGWLHQISLWNKTPDMLECYVVPESIKSPRPAGLFVIIRGEVSGIEILDAYGLAADKLYIPVHTELFPILSQAELKSKLVWDLQIFHPHLGFVGFEKRDRLDLAALLFCLPPTEQKWNKAHSGIDPVPVLREIRIIKPSLEDVIESLKKGIDGKPLSEIPKDEQSAAGKLLDDLKHGLFKGLLYVSEKIPGSDSGSGTPGPLNKMENWLRKNIDDLEKKRNAEIQRLLKMFDENTDEALRYAIPMDSPYLNRGTAEPGWKLFRNTSLNFNLGKLGGGQAVDGWNIGSYADDLRAKYHRAAQKAIENNDFKKAAYIYAHLLGDFYGAANVLVQGKHYREAALLYKDHLKNIPMAAETLEKGGLTLEAIELYEELHKYEKVGDLYDSIHQRDKASEYYEKSIDSLMGSGDYLEATRIIRTKLEDNIRAGKLLLKGWGESKQSEQCLKQYFDLVQDKEREELSKEVLEVYREHTRPHQKNSFLNVMAYMNSKNTDPEFMNTTRDLAYEIISDEAESGNAGLINELKKFVNDDRLIASDCSRFMSNSRKRVESKTASAELQLDRSVKWLEAVCHRNQFVFLGIKNSRLQLARGNWYGNFEYYSWEEEVAEDEYFLIADQYQSNVVMIHAAKGISLGHKFLSKNKYFDEELLVRTSGGISANPIGITVNSDGYTVLEGSPSSMTLHHYNANNTLKGSEVCHFKTETLYRYYKPFSGMLYRNKTYYSSKGNYLLKISEDGRGERIDMNDMIKMIVISAEFSSYMIAVNSGDTVRCISQDFEDWSGHISLPEDKSPIDMRFIGSDLLAVAFNSGLAIYRVLEKGRNYVKENHFDVPHTIVSILQGPRKDRCAVLDEQGRILVFNLEENK